MNHTAHCLLSFPDEEVLLGNFIGDYIKGKAWQAYPPGVQRGILLHRMIDGFTDSHPVVRDSTARVRPFSGRYAAPVVDILYDHLLCRTWEKHVPLPFADFAEWAYHGLDKHSERMPLPLQRRWPQMLAGRFLDGYRTPAGVAWVLSMFSRRIPGQLDVDGIAALFFAEIETFEQDFDRFFPALQASVERFSVET